jgi:hypothetical protein
MSNHSGGIFQVREQKKGYQILTPYQRHPETNQAVLSVLEQTNKVKSNNINLIKVFFFSLAMLYLFQQTQVYVS